MHLHTLLIIVHSQHEANEYFLYDFTRAVLGDPRTNQNPALLSFAILFMRWHNVQAQEVKKSHPDWNDEEIFQRARRQVIASLQSIFVYEYLPAFLGGVSLDPYEGYKADVHPGISHMFQAAAFRFGHSLIPPGIMRRDGKCNFMKTLRLCSTWWDSSVSLIKIELIFI
jgi:dual oxidase